jgi:hypothetical protein
MSTEEKLTTHVVATITVEVAVSGPWGAEATIGYMVKDAERAALNVINGLQGRNMRLIGKPTFHTVSHHPKD